jgi:hypothetical protein
VIEPSDHSVRRANSLDEWVDQKRNFERFCRVGLDTVGEVEVSTVFLGLNMAGGTAEHLVCFETLMCGPGGQDVIERYETWDEAAAGHMALVAVLKGELQ